MHHNSQKDDQLLSKSRFYNIRANIKSILSKKVRYLIVIDVTLYY